MTRAALGALLSHWRRHPGQLATLLLGLALATALWSAVQAINAEARTSYDRAAGTLGLGGYDTLSRPGEALGREDFVTLRRAGWRVSPVVEGRLTVPGEGPPVTVLGLDFLSAPPGALPPDLAALGAGIEPARLFTAPGLAFAAPALARRLRGTLGPGAPELRGDPAVPPGQVRRIEAGVSGPARSRLLDDCGHLPHRERPAAVLEAIEAFLSEFHGPSNT